MTIQTSMYTIVWKNLLVKRGLNITIGRDKTKYFKNKTDHVLINKF